MVKLTPGKAVRRFCLWCCNVQSNEIRFCTAEACIFYKHRLGKGRISVKTIRKHCFDCDSEGRNSIKACDFKECPCYGYRFGKRLTKTQNSIKKGIEAGKRLANWKKQAKQGIVANGGGDLNAG